MEWTVPSWQAAFAWLWLMGWSAYGVEACATFAPEYKDTAHDTSLALRTAAIFSLAVYILLPLGLGGVLHAGGDRRESLCVLRAASSTSSSAARPT